MRNSVEELARRLGRALTLQGSRVGLGVFLTMLALYLVTGSREPPWGDAQIMWEVADGLVERGAIDVETDWPPQSHEGPDGRLYSQYGLLPSLVSVPAAWLTNVLAGDDLRARAYVLPLTSHVAPAVLGALTCVLFFGLCRRLRATSDSATFATIMLAVATGVWVYARSPYSEALQIMCFTGFASALLGLLEDPSRRRAMWTGVWAGLLINTKAVFLLAALGAVVCLAWLWRGQRDLLARCLGRAAVTILPFLLVFLAYNHIRWGSPFETGYAGSLRLFAEDPLDGLWGLAFSPGKSIFLYNPPLLAALIGLPAFVRTYRREAAVLACITLPVMLVYVRYLEWSGGFCWGPRFWVFAVPVLLLPILSVLEATERAASRTIGYWSRAIVVGLVLTLGLGVQVLGNAFYWDHYIRIAKHAQPQWLGHPDRRGAWTPDLRRGRCDACFEDMHGLLWLPPFSPIAGHLWLLRHVAAGDDAVAAEADAPWHPYTTLSLSIGKPYHRVRIDWWGLLWIEDHRMYRKSGIVLLSVMLLTGLAGAVTWRRSLRK